MTLADAIDSILEEKGVYELDSKAQAQFLYFVEFAIGCNAAFLRGEATERHTSEDNKELT